MKIYAINGGPRKGWNTDKMLEAFLEGAASVSDEVETEMIYLHDLTYEGCISCYACQRDNDETYGCCQVKDGIYELLRKVSLSDGVVFGSPVYFSDLTAKLRAFMERFLYQYLSFNTDNLEEFNNAPKPLRTAMIYTMNLTEEMVKALNYELILGVPEHFLERVFGFKPVSIYVYDTYQYEDYSKYRAKFWDEKAKLERHKVQFPLDCKKAYDAGKEMALAGLQNK